METHVAELWSSEQLVLCRDDEVGLRAVIAIDDTTLGPGLGGVRRRAYPSDDDAVRECRRLAAGMTLKNALAGIPFGGAKSVILQGETPAGREALMRRFGEFIARAGGAYLPGVDMGTTTEDLETMAQAGIDVSCSTEDPSPWTALGVAAAIRSAVEHRDGREGIEGIQVVVQGAGHVGATLAELLAGDGALVSVCDVDTERADAVAARVGGRRIDPVEALSAECDVLAPCAIARVASVQTIPAMRCRLLVGGANDTLGEPGDAQRLAERGIVYVPDYVANAGGVIHIAALRERLDEPVIRERVLQIGERVGELLREADLDGRLPLAVAEDRARQIVRGAREVLA